MTTKRRLSCEIECSQLEHLNLLEELDSLPLADSCCQICHCDCYSSHRSTEQSAEETEKSKAKKKLKKQLKDSNNNNSNESNQRNTYKAKICNNSKKKVKNRSSCSTQSLERRILDNKFPSLATNSNKCTKLKRSKSVGSFHSLQPAGNPNRPQITRDCELLQDLISSHTPRFEVRGNEANLSEMNSMPLRASKSTMELPSTSKSLVRDTDWSGPKICESLANLCLKPSIREAYEKVSMHDKKILNRMANKRNEKIMANENAWLARKFWENERYERELLKCEQMEEYKRAVRDKQFQDFILTKERLNELAQRDFQELQRLRSILAQKDVLTKKRLDAIRVERDILLCQRRCEELSKSEAVNLHQEEQNLGDVLRKQDICNRLTHRLRRADEIRNEQLEGYLKRLRYDNLIEQLVHQEHWQEVQEQEKQKRDQLKEYIEAKSKGTQRFIAQRQHRMDALSKTAKISASLRELVRSSVTPESALAFGNVTNTANLGKLLFDPPILKLSLK